jgi:hypothetical protein
MFEFDGNMHEIRRRFVSGILAGLEPELLHAYVSDAAPRDRQQGREAA